MITERIAIGMLDGEFPAATDDPRYTRQFYKSMQAFTDASLKLCYQGKFRKLKTFLKVAFRLFKEGNETAKHGIVNVNLFTLSISPDKNPASKKLVEPFIQGLRPEYDRIHYMSGI